MSSVQSVVRAMALLRAVAERPSGLVDLAGETGLATSTAARLLATLEDEGAISRDLSGRYRIGPLLEQLSGGVDAVQALDPVVRPHLERLSATLDEAACLAVVIGTDIVTVSQVDAPKPVQAEDWTGTRVPLHAGSAGLVVMATWPDAEVNEYLAGELEQCSPRTITDPDRLWRLIRTARSRGVLWSHGEYVEGLSCASAAIIDSSDRAVGALYSYGPTYRYPRPANADTIAALVLEHAVDISSQLGNRLDQRRNAS